MLGDRHQPPPTYKFYQERDKSIPTWPNIQIYGVDMDQAELLTLTFYFTPESIEIDFLNALPVRAIVKHNKLQYNKLHP